jgi:hypothetical protein
MNWYIAKVVFRISAGANGQKSQFDEHLKLVNANSFEEALLKARMLGLKEECSFLNDQRQQVKWEFVNVAELIPIREITDGLEVYSQIHETASEEATTYIHNVHQRAASLQLTHRPLF